MNKKKEIKNKKKLIKEFSRKKPNRFSLPPETKRWVLGILMFLMAALIGLSFFGLAGPGGRAVRDILVFLIGKVAFFTPLVLVVAGLVLLKTQYKRYFFPIILAVFILILGASGALGGLAFTEKPGGWIGYIISWPFLELFGIWANLIIFGTLIIAGMIMLWHLFGSQLLKTIPAFKSGRTETEKKEKLMRRIVKGIRAEPKFKVKEIFSSISEKTGLRQEEKNLKRQDIKNETSSFAHQNTLEEISELNLKTKLLTENAVFSYELPPLDLLEADKELPASEGDIKINSTIIKRTLQNFGIQVEMSEVNLGPTVTQYTLKPAEGIKLSKITVLNNDLSLALATHPIRIEAPIPGRALVGIEIPNRIRALVRLRNLFECSAFQNSTSSLVFILGRDVAGNPVFADLARMPHLLVAGSTGTGKTICLNNIILSLLYQNQPETMRFILIDPKRVEFPVYQGLPHLLTPVIFNSQQAVNVLKWLTGEMERRFEVFAEAKARDINTYNENALKQKEDFMPYIVLIIDELADLMAARGREIEAGIVRLAQMARAVGIHLIVATQRPSVEVITGLIKANISSRITFQVASQVDSRTVLDMAGAEKLLGAGDLLFISAEISKPRRIQGAYISEKEVKRVTNFIKTKNSKDKIESETEIDLKNNMEKGLLEIEERGTNSPRYEYEEDPLYEEAKKMVIEAKKASASLLQRRLRLGYARAARLIDILEEKGVVGPGDGAKPREILIKTEVDEGQGWRKI